MTAVFPNVSRVLFPEENPQDLFVIFINTAIYDVIERKDINKVASLLTEYKEPNLINVLRDDKGEAYSYEYNVCPVNVYFVKKGDKTIQKLIIDFANRFLSVK
jgi:hypothetical protein